MCICYDFCLDIIFLRSWVTVPIPHFYIVVTDKLLPTDKSWVGMKTVGRLRHEMGAKPEINEDSHYKPIKRKPYVPTELVLTKPLQAQLPYRLKPKLAAQSKVIEKRPKMVERNTAVILEPHESRINNLMHVLDVVAKDRQEQQKMDLEKRQKEFKKKSAEIDKKRQTKMRETKQKICRKQSKKQGNKSQRTIMQLGDGQVLKDTT